MRVSRERLLTEAEATGFRPEILEKVFQLLSLLEGFQRHPFLKGRLALKGGTALNLFLSDLPRLSVDIDLNYVGAAERDTMLQERPKVEQAVHAVCAREGMNVTRQPSEHAGGKWRLRYESSIGEGGNLEIDLNFVFRVPLWPVTSRDSRRVGSFGASGIPVLDIHELAAGKLAALFARHASRDLFDAHRLLSRHDIDPSRLRLGFVVYGAMNRRDWRTIRIDDVGFEPRELKDQLMPVVRAAFLGEIGDADQWALRLVDECRKALRVVLPFTDAENEFLERLHQRGEIAADSLTDDADLARKIGLHPGLLWKAMNVRKVKRQ